MNREKMACTCRGVTYGWLIDAVEQGARTFEEVQRLTKCSMICGQCREFIEHFISELIVSKDNR